MSATPEEATPSTGLPPAAAAPHPELVAQVARTLDQLEQEPTSTEHLDTLHANIQTHGLAAFFQAVQQRLSEKPLAALGAPAALTAGLEKPAVAAEAPEALTLGLEALVPRRGDDGVSRQTWADYIGSRVWQPLRVFHPTTLDNVRSIMRQAAAEGCRVKAVGSGHSFADVAVTRDFLIDTHGLCKPLRLEHELLRPGVRTETLFETEAGIRVRDLNDALWNAGLGLVNMGGYDGQTIAGVISTSTHGSGIEFGPLSSQVESLVLVSANGKTYRIEPSDGITDAAKWAARHPDIELRQDDDWFYACQVGVGCMGVIYSVVLRVRERYYMKEERTLSVWSQVKRDLLDGGVLRENSHYEVLVNPYPTNGDHTCLITRRNPVAEPDTSPLLRPHRNFLVELAAITPGASQLLLTIFNLHPPLTPTIIDSAMGALARDYIDRSYYVFNIGAANDVPAYGSEIGFTMDRYQAAVERIFEIAAQRQRVGQAYLTSPFSLRFVKASKAYMSMMYGADTCMIEFPVLKDSVGGKELLQQIETEMYAFGGRPHWGLLNFLSGANDLIAAMYPKLPEWLAVYRQLNPNGVFDNAFTERCGFSPRGFGREPEVA
jgi:L-gulono-1,4-lactone dehydrogenase